MWLRPEAQGASTYLKAQTQISDQTASHKGELRAEEKKHSKDLSSPGLGLGLPLSVAEWTVEKTERGTLSIPASL